MTVNRRQIREGLVGLLIVGGLVFGLGLILWINNFRADSSPYKFSVVFADANGMSPGVPVRLRGVNIGQVVGVTPSIEKVIVDAVVDRPDVILPRQARYTVGQRGLIGETFLEILPEPEAKTARISVEQFRSECQAKGSSNKEVVCPGETLPGETPTRVLDLVRSLNTVANRINTGVLDELETTVREIGTSAKKFGDLSGDIRTTAKEINATARSFNLAAGSASKTIDRLGAAGDAVTQVAKDTDSIVRDNRVQIARTLENLSRIAKDLSAVTPTLADPKFSQSLASLAENAAQTAVNVRRLSDGLSDPATIDALRETLDAARNTFRNAEKVSSDLNDLTGDPKFRDNLKKLVEGLGDLVATAEEQAPKVRNASHTKLPEAPR